jgi:hypothetical protein
VLRSSLDDLRAKKARGETRAAQDAPEVECDDESFWARAEVRMPKGKTSVHLRLDTDVLDWFRAQGAGHLTRMNAVLRAYVDAQARAARRP